MRWGAEGEGYLQKAGRYLAAGAAALAIAMPGEEAEAASLDYDPCDIEAAIEVDSESEIATTYTDDREYLVEKIESELEEVEMCERSDVEGMLYGEGFDLEKAEDISTTGLNQINSLLEGLRDEGTLQEIGEIVRNDLREGPVTTEGVRAAVIPAKIHETSLMDAVRSPPSVDGYIVEGTFTVRSDETEWGGLVDWRNGVEFEVYEPLGEFSDGMYMPSPALIAQVSDSIDVDRVDQSASREYAGDQEVEEQYPMESGDALRFHAHAVNRAGDEEFAGPSIPDLRSVGDVGAGVVVTALGVDDDGEIVVNLDWYTSGVEDTVVDLGVYSTGVELPADMQNCRSRNLWFTDWFEGFEN